MIHQRKILKAIAYAILLCFTSLTGAQPLYAVPANTQLREGFNNVVGSVDNPVVNGDVMNIHQNSGTAVNKWNDFSIGADATVNFTGTVDGFNSFNYVKDGPISEIYGQLNAIGGNIFIANPAGVQIGNSAQINVGSLYVTNKSFSDAELRNMQSKAAIESALARKTEAGTAQLMSLGSITSATSVTFDGSRIVLDTDRLFSGESGVGTGEMAKDNIKIFTNDKNEVVLGYTSYTTTDPTDPNAGQFGDREYFDITVKGQLIEDFSGYMWVEDLFQLQAMDTKLDGWFALRNAIDANYTASNGGFNPIGTGTGDDAFTGRFDGLGYNIFGLNINGTDYAGLFGYAGNGAYIRNFTINGGTITGGTNVGAAVGAFGPGAFISNITNTADVTGTKNVGGIVGSGTGEPQDTELSDLVNIGSVHGTDDNVGGIIGSMENVTIAGETYNLGAVTGDKGNVGGIAGLAINSTIGDNNDFRIYNQLNVTGGWNVGGIVGYIYGENSSISNVENHGNITATGSIKEQYAYHQYASGLTNGWDNQYIDTRVANAGGIAGQSGESADSKTYRITIDNVHNDGDVTTVKGTHKNDKGESEYDYYIAGNVGGIVGRARYTDITNAENSENLVAGAHNVGGIAGYLADGKVSASGNNGGDITATGARLSDDSNFAKEKVDGANNASEFIIGNIGGIVGYLYGRSAQIEDAANRGSVHSAAIDDPDNVLPISEASNVGGIAGKVSMGNHTKNPNVAGDKAYTTEELLGMFRDSDTSAATIRNSYNTGSVEGYTGVGGIAGQMVKGSVTGSYNLGTLSSTRTATDATREALNMGGIVGDMTAATDPTKSALIYDVYNAGTIGDSTYTYVGRHVGGIVGRFSGTLEKAYNTGDIYNGYSVVGGVVGWWNSGNITNVFNTGNITVVNRDTNGLNSHVGGIVGSVNAKRDDGAAQDTQKTLSYAYNLGTIRSFIDKDHQDGKLHGTGPLRDNINVVSGIVGGVTEYDTKGGSTKNTVTIDNVYSTGNIYAARWDKDANNGNGAYVQYDKDRVGAIWAQGYTNDGEESVTVKDSFFIKPIGSQGERESMFSSISKEHVGVEGDGYQTIDWGLKDDKQTFVNGGFTFIDDLSKEHAAAINNNYAYGWRIEEGTLPILYAFTPNTAKNEDKWIGQLTGGATVQYGTAANPLLTIIQGGGKDVSLDWGSLGLSGAGGLALYGGGNLTLTGFGTELGRYYNGIIFSAGDLYIDATGDAARHNLGSGSQLYGQNVTFNAGTNDTTLYGSITSTNGKITIEGGDVSVIGSLESKAEGEPTRVSGIAANAAQADDPDGVKIDPNALADPGKSVATVGDAYSHLTDAAGNGDHDITIDAKGSAEVLYGNMGEGKITTDGNFTVSGKDSVYVDSDLHIGGDLSLNSDGEIVLDLSNMGDISKENLHINFLDHFNKDTAGGGAINVGGYKEGSSFSGDFMIGLDMWEDATTPGEEGAFNLDKYDVTQDDIDNASGLNGKKPHKLVEDINALNIDGVSGTAQEHTFIWVENAEQLAGIQQYKNEHKDSGILGYNFALKDNIDASSIENYEGIASGTESNGRAQAFTGTFDGRGFAIIGLDVNDNGTTDGKYVKDAGIFGNIGVVRDEEGEVVQTGTVKDLGVYSSKFTGGDTAGAIAGRSEGTITGITTLGNRVEVTGKGATTEINRGTGAGNEADKPITVGAAGGIAGINAGTITNSHVSDTVIAGEPGNTTGTELMTVAGGVVGINQGNGASIGDFATYWLKGAPDVTSTSAVLTNVLENKNSNLHGLGGIAGINENGITNVAAFGVTNGTYGSQSNKSNEYVGGIAGVNYFAIVGAYNESVVTGSSSIGGIAGKNDYRNDLAQEYQGFYTGAEINNSVNAGSVTVIGDGEYAGGIVGSNYGWVNYGRNTGSVSGTNSVGGIAGLNAYGAGLKNLSNAIAAEISGEENVGGIAGTNAGEITAESNIVNEGKITGKTNVGGVAGVNEKTGVIRGGEDESGSKRTTNLATITGNTYVGGIAGVNKGEIANTNSDVTFAFDDGAPAQYVGGVAGKNEGKITNATNASDIIAENAEYVGGITGVNAENAVLENAGNSGNVFGGSHVGGVAAVNNSSHDGGKITNSGIVTAENGGAAGIFYENEAALNNVELVNTGSVTGQSNNHGTGGIIGVNNGSITNSKLLNNGSVSGNNNTGGLIGVNSGTISGSTLANTGYVNAGSGENVGGLIGKNTGSVIGGRNEADTMYVHKIYNNGGVSAQQGTNVGGLIGNNEGKLTAGYNTGNVRGQQNAGGIAGTNNGSISEVFNTVMTGDAEATGSISGVDNVGGLVGHNEKKGTLTDAYNTTAVNGGGVKGNAVGTNDGAVKNVYAWNTNGKLIGGGSGTKENTYSFVSGDGSANFVIPALGQMESESYEGFGFGSTWKNYDGWSLPMLKVFLTKGEVSQNGVTAADGLAAFNNANSLIVFVPDPETGGMYMTVFSAQIAGSFGPDGVFNPNNLGYDLEGVYVRGNNNGFLHSDGWDRIKNFRERKAELYFHNGGMEYAEEM